MGLDPGCPGSCPGLKAAQTAEPPGLLFWFFSLEHSVETKIRGLGVSFAPGVSLLAGPLS